MPIPLIGVTVSRLTAYTVYPVIARAIQSAGGRPIKWRDAAEIDVDAVDGIVVGGGDSIAPAVSREGVAFRTTTTRTRDLLDKWALKAAFADGIPVLGIGFGAVRLNAALGGTAEAGEGEVARLERCAIRPLPGSALSEVIGNASLPAKGMQKQYIATLGLGMHIAARDERGAVQAIERARPPFAMGVVWRPDLQPFDRFQRAIFATLVSAAALHRRERGVERKLQWAAVPRGTEAV